MTGVTKVPPKFYMCRLHLLFRPVVLFLFAVDISANAGGGIFSVAGTVKTTVYGPESGSVRYSVSGHFNYQCSNSWWQIETRTSNSLTGKVAIENCMSINDGVRHFTLFEGSTNKGMPLSIACPIKFPPPGRIEHFAIWLMLSEKPELPLLGKDKIRRFINVPDCQADILNHNQNQGQFVADYLNSGGRFLSKLTIRNDGVRIATDLSPEGNLTAIIDRFPAPFEKGFTELDFSIVETKKTEDLILPGAAIYKKFSPKRDGKGFEDVYAPIITEIKVEEWKSGVSEQAVMGIAPPEKLYAMDYRPQELKAGKSVSYVSKGDEWKPVSDPQIRMLVKMANQPERGKANAPSGVARFVLIFVLIFTSVFLLVIIIKKGRNHG